MKVEAYGAAALAQHTGFSTGTFFSVIRPIIFGEGMRLKSDVFSNIYYIHKNGVRGKKKGFVLLKDLREFISGVRGVSADENGK